MAKTLSTKLFTRYQQEMRVRGYARRTITTYTSMLRSFVYWLEGDVHPRDVDSQVVRRYLLDLLDEGYSRSTLDQAISALKLLYVDLYGWNPAHFEVRRPRREQKLPYAPTRDEILRMAALTRNEKHRLIILLLYASGMRVSELVALKVGDVDLDTLQVRIRGGKGKKDRISVLADRIVPDLRIAMRDRGADQPLFTGVGGGTYSVRSVQHLIHAAGVRAGLTRRVHPHCMRHSFATHLLENGTDLLVVRILLGHVKVHTTARYIQLKDPNKAIRSPL